jgi:hydroxymethylpyrimidine pyrophosphatase-like HAD family hydrolase
MHVYFDLDNTIIDETGNNVRPGMYELLTSFKHHGIQLSIWTASVRERAEPILYKLNLKGYFSSVICRDDYDPNATWGKVKPKDIRFGDGDMLIDDNQNHIDFVESIGRKGFRITPFISYIDPEPDSRELERLHKFVLPNVPFKIQRDAWIKRVFKTLFRKKQQLPIWIK